MNAADARRLVHELGADDHVERVVAEAPEPNAEQRDALRAVLTTTVREKVSAS